MRHLLLILVLALAGCQSPSDGAAADGTASDGTALAAGYVDVVGAAVAQQVADGVPVNPLGRVLEECVVADLDALTRIGEGLAVTDTTPEVLNVVVQDPEGDPTVQCAIRYGESSAGAVVLSTKETTLTPDEVRAELVAQDFMEIEDVSAEGLDDDRVLLFESTSFQATRVVWVADGFQISLTANADIADTGALLEALPVAIDELTRVLAS